jgi:hypothetical protein
VTDREGEMMRCRITILLALMTVAELAAAATWTVRKDGTGDYAIIQEALNAAAAGDTVLIGPGEFLERFQVPGDTIGMEAYAYVPGSEITIIGAGSDQTLIGPQTYMGAWNGLPSPIGVMGPRNGVSGTVRIMDLTMRNCYGGLAMAGILYMDRCIIDQTSQGVTWLPMGYGGWIKDSRIDGYAPVDPDALYIVGDRMPAGTACNILVEDCQIEHATSTMDDINGITFRRCSFANASTGLQFYYDSRGLLEDCTFSNLAVGAIELTMGYGAVCEIARSEIAGSQGALLSAQPGGRFIIQDSRLEGGAYATLIMRQGSGAWIVSNCDLIKGSGPMVRCGDGTVVTHDLRNNYWGTTDEATIQSWIIDHNDDPNIGATVLYAPFAGQSLPTEPTSWGALKASFR